MTAIATSAPVATDYAANVKCVESIGRRSTALLKSADATAAEIIALVGESYDWTARGAKPAAVHLFACGEAKGANVPAQKDDQKRVTNYGTGVNTLVAAITRALDAPADESAPVMRVALKGAGSAVVPTDHPAYALLLALLGADAAEGDAPTE